MIDHEDKIATARALAVNKAVYFGGLIYGFVFVAVPNLGTDICVTKSLILAYDPAWALAASTEELAADIAHEAHHVIRNHFARFTMMDDRDIANIAADLAINPDLRAGGWKLVEKALMPAMFKLPDQLSMEEYYDLLRQRKEEQQEKNKKEGKKDPGLMALLGAEGADPGDEPGDGAGTPKPKGGVCQGNCGGIAGGSTSPAIEAQLEATPDLGRTPTEVRAIEKKVAGDIKAFAQTSGRGSLPASFITWAKSFDDEPHVRWQDELSQVLRDTTGRIQSGGDDFSLARPSKRSYMRGILRPGLVEHLPEVAIVRDTSGSMGHKQLADCCREAFGIMQALGIDEVWYCDADAAVAMNWVRVGAEFFRKLSKRHGGGGTDFTPAILDAQRLTPHPDILIYCTDGDGGAPAEEPAGMSVVWCIVPSYYNKAPVKWGHTVLVSDDPATRKCGMKPDDEDDDD